MMTIDEMIEIKKRYGLSYEYIAEKSGVPMSTVQKVFSRTTPTPRMSMHMASINSRFCGAKRLKCEANRSKMFKIK